MKDNLTEQDIDQIALRYRNSETAGDTASLYMLVLSDLSDNPDQIGSTYFESGLLIFGTTLDRYIQNHPDLRANYLESTALHEFGHQLGLAHDSFSDCLMQAFVEQGYGYQSPGSVITDFCNYEKQQIAQAKAKL